MTTIYARLMSQLSSASRYQALQASKFLTRVKGFFVKAVKFVKNKVLPIFKQVAPLVQPLIPGITPILVGINALDKSPAVTSTVKCSAVAKTNALGSFKDSTGDYFKLTMQVRLCELDSNDQPIYIDTIANNDYQWQNASEPFRYFVNAADQPPQQTSVVNVEFSNGKFAERYAAYVAAGKPIHYQIRYKVEFDKTNVPMDYKAVLTYDMSVGTLEVTEEDRQLLASVDVVSD